MPVLTDIFVLPGGDPPRPVRPHRERSRSSSRIRCLRVTLLLVLASAGAAHSSEEAFDSRTLAPDPTWQATAGAFAVTESRPSALAANPTGALATACPTAAFSHLQWAADLSREWAALTTPLGSRLGVGADLGLLRGAALEGFDEAGNSTGTFSPTEWDAGAALALALGRGFDLGVGTRYFRLEDPVVPLTSLGFSFGVRWAGGPRTVAASVTDLGSTSDDRYSLPTRYRLGAEQWVSSFLRIGLGAEVGTATAFALGAELHPTPWIALLGGLGSETGESGRGTHWSTGLSLERSGVRASYAFVLDGELGDRHQLGFELPLRRNDGGWDRAGLGQTP